MGQNNPKGNMEVFSRSGVASSPLSADAGNRVRFYVRSQGGQKYDLFAVIDSKTDKVVILCNCGGADHAASRAEALELAADLNQHFGDAGDSAAGSVAREARAERDVLPR